MIYAYCIGSINLVWQIVLKRNRSVSTDPLASVTKRDCQTNALYDAMNDVLTRHDPSGNNKHLWLRNGCSPNAARSSGTQCDQIYHDNGNSTPWTTTSRQAPFTVWLVHCIPFADILDHHWWVYMHCLVYMSWNRSVSYSPFASVTYLDHECFMRCHGCTSAAPFNHNYTKEGVTLFPAAGS